jgi:hypothetical protein
MLSMAQAGYIINLTLTAKNKKKVYLYIHL